jgi:hypothetical protein
MLRSLPVLIFVAVVVALSWVGRDAIGSWLQPALQIKAIASTDIPAFDILDPEDFKVESPGFPVEMAPATPTPPNPEATLRENLQGRLTLRPIPAGTQIDSASHINLRDKTQAGDKVMVFAAADPLDTLRVGDTVDLVLVPVDQPAATPGLRSGGESAKHDAAGQTIDETVHDALVLQIGEKSEDGTRSLLVAIPASELPERSLGRTVAFPIFTVTK